MARVLQTWLKLNASRIFDVWRLNAQEEKRLLKAGMAVLKKWLRYGAWRAFDSWQEALQQGKEESMKQEAVVQLAAKVCMFFFSVNFDDLI